VQFGRNFCLHLPNRSILCHIPEDSNPKNHHCKDLKPEQHYRYVTMPGSLSSMNLYSGTKKGQSEVLSMHHFLTVLNCAGMYHENGALSFWSVMSLYKFHYKLEHIMRPKSQCRQLNSNIHFKHKKPRLSS